MVSRPQNLCMKPSVLGHQLQLRLYLHQWPFIVFSQYLASLAFPAFKTSPFQKKFAASLIVTLAQLHHSFCSLTRRKNISFVPIKHGVFYLNDTLFLINHRGFFLLSSSIPHCPTKAKETVSMVLTPLTVLNVFIIPSVSSIYKS